MKICLHTTNEISANYIGGVERFLIKIAKELKILGCSPFIVCSSRIETSYIEGVKVLGRIPAQYKKKAINYSYLTTDFIKNEVIDDTSDFLGVAKKISTYVIDQLDGIDADIYHLNSFISSLCTTGSKFRNRTVVTNHDNDLELDRCWGTGFYKKFVYHVTQKELNLHHLNYCVVPSEHYAIKFTNELGLKVRSVKQGVHVEDFPTRECEYSTSAIRVKAANDIFQILLPARLRISQKGHDIAIAACKILKDKGFKFKLIISGGAKSTVSEKLALETLIKNSNLEKEVILSSFDDILDAYNECDVVISPERYCSYGLSISESLAMGIHTVLRDIPTYQEIATGYTHAHLFSCGDTAQLAEILMTLCREKSHVLRTETIRFRVNNDIRECAKLYLGIYFEILNTRKYNDKLI